MTDTAGNRKTGRGQFFRLIRQLAAGECGCEPVGNTQIRLTGAQTRDYPAGIVRQAVSEGLARMNGGRIGATAQAGPYLRRALVEEDEAFLQQHGEIASVTIEVEGSRQPARRNLMESPLGVIARMKDRDGKAFLPAEALEAGERLAGDFTRGQLQPRVTASWEPRLSTRAKGGAGGQAEIADSAIMARSRFTRAVEAMGPELSGVAMDVCCFAKGLETVERERQWPARSAKLMLRTALLALARHYAPPPPARRSHHWRDEDLRQKE